jgi:hypothetical protein
MNNKNKNVFCFHQEKIKHYIKKYEKTGYLSDYLIPYYSHEIIVNANPRLANVTKTINTKQHRHNKQKFDHELMLLKENFSTESSKFMFPTILSKYRKGINPVKALYNEIQRVLCQYNKHNTEHQWVINLFKDNDWFASLISAINTDIAKICDFQNKWKQNVHYSIQEIVHSMHSVKENLEHYKEVFLLVNDLSIEVLN